MSALFVAGGLDKAQVYALKFKPLVVDIDTLNANDMLTEALQVNGHFTFIGPNSENLFPRRMRNTGKYVLSSFFSLDPAQIDVAAFPIDNMTWDIRFSIYTPVQIVNDLQFVVNNSDVDALRDLMSATLFLSPLGMSARGLTGISCSQIVFSAVRTLETTRDEESLKTLFVGTRFFSFSSANNHRYFLKQK